MKKILTIASKEWRAYLQNPVGFVFVGLLVTVTSWMYFGDLFINGQADLTPYWTTMGFLYSIFVPAISMGLIAEEKKNGNWEVLLSLPINETQIVWGKFLGGFCYLATTLLFSAPAIVTLMWLGKPDIGLVGGGAIGLLAMGGAYLATGILASSVSSQSIVGFLGASVFLILNNLMGQEIVLSRLGSDVASWIEKLSLGNRIMALNQGLIRVDDVLFVISWIAASLIMAVLVLKSRDK